jgi:anti-anti-sigma factor
MSRECIDRSGCSARTARTRGGNQTTGDRGGGVQVLRMPEELDLATADGVVEQGYAAIARHTRLLLLDLTGTSFCDARGLSVFTRIANRSEATGCCYGLIAPQPLVARVLRISGLDARIPVFATIGDALAHLGPGIP